MSGPKHPDITVKLVGEDGNAINIIGLVIRGLRRGGVSENEIASFQEDAMSGDYDNVLQTAMRWVNVE